jgi:hypothetical protein
MFNTIKSSDRLKNKNKVEPTAPPPAIIVPDNNNLIERQINDPRINLFMEQMTGIEKIVYKVAVRELPMFNIEKSVGFKKWIRERKLSIVKELENAIPILQAYSELLTTEELQNVSVSILNELVKDDLNDCKFYTSDEMSTNLLLVLDDMLPHMNESEIDVIMKIKHILDKI